MTRIEAIKTFKAAVKEHKIDVCLLRTRLPTVAMITAIEAIQNGAHARTVVEDMEQAAR
jgi:hypothetical protein